MSNDPSDPTYIAFVATDIRDTGSNFVVEAQKYLELMHYDDTQCPFGTPKAGNDQIDRMLDTVLRLAGEVHVEIKQAMENHGEKLQSASQNYTSAEDIIKSEIQNVGQLYTIYEQQELPADQPG